MQLAYFSFIGFLVFTLSFPQSLSEDKLCRTVHCPPIRECKNGGCVCKNGAKDIECKFPPVTTTRRVVAKTLTTPSDDACSHHTCQQNCKCVPSCQHEDGYYCESPSGYIGKKCDIAIPDLNCTQNNITISIKQEFLQSVYANDHISNGSACFYMAPSVDVNDSEKCKVCTTMDGINYHLLLTLPFDQCGTTYHRYSKDVLTVSNLVWANLNNPNKAYDAPVPVLQFVCNYTNDYVALVSLKPAVATTGVHIERTVVPKGNIQLCKIGSACPGSCPPLYSVTAGAAYTVSETIHVSMSINQSDVTSFSSSFSGPPVVIVEEMFLSCAVSDDEHISIVSSGCPTSALVARINQAGVSNVVCVSFKVPRFRSCTRNQFFIQAKLRILDRSIVPVCFERMSSMRRKRSADLDVVDPRKLTSDITFGPIYALRGSIGHSGSTLFPMKDEEKFMPVTKSTISRTNPGLATNKLQLRFASGIVFIIVLVLVCVFVFLTVISLVVCWCRSCLRRVEEHSVQRNTAN